MGSKLCYLEKPVENSTYKQREEEHYNFRALTQTQVLIYFNSGDKKLKRGGDEGRGGGLEEAVVHCELR